MPKRSIKYLSEETGMTRETIGKRLDGVPFEVGAKQARLFDSKVALAKIYMVAEDGSEQITAAEASRQLTIARKQQIDLEMEVTRKDRIPLETITEINDEAFSNIAGLIKSHVGKPLDQELANELFAQLREIGAKIKQA